MITTIITSVIGALCVAGVLAIVKSRWLYVIAPKLYMNTPISDGQIVSLTLANAGLTSEEDVAVTLRPACKFELIATSKSTLVVNGKTLTVPKLSRLETVTVLILVEGKAFDQVDIESIESRHTKGKVVEKKEKATGAWESFVAIPIIALVMLLPFVFGTQVGADMKMSSTQYISEKLELMGNSTQLAGFKVESREKYAIGKLEGALKKSLIEIEISEVVRRKEVLTLVFRVSNNTKDPLLLDGDVSSTAGSGPVDFWDSRTKTVPIAPGESVSVKMKTYLPEDTKVKIIHGDFKLKNLAGDYITVSQAMEFK